MKATQTVFSLSDLVFYKDEECTKQFDLDEENLQHIINEEAISQGQSGQVSVYLKNESPNDFELQEIKILDEKIDIAVDHYYIKSQDKAKVTLTFFVPEDAIKPLKGRFILEGEYIIRE